MVDKLHVRTVGQNYLYFLQVAEGMNDNHGSREAFEAQAEREREHLVQLRDTVEQDVGLVARDLAHEAGAHTGETQRYRDLETELDRLEWLQDAVKAYLEGKKPDGVSPEEKARGELLALATRARVSATARRALGRKPRGSYDAEVIQALVKGKVAKDPRHATHLLNLSKGLAEGWSNEELLYWAICYRQGRERGLGKGQAVARADKSLGVGQ